MAHIHTKPGQHDHTVSGFIVRIDENEPKIILHKHKKLGKYLQFGGHIELDENPWQALTHELLEESGYDMSQLKILQPKSRLKITNDVTLHPVPVSYNTHSFSKDHYHTDISYVFTAVDNPAHTLADGESEKILAFTRKDILAMTTDETYENVKKICLFIFDEALKDWEAIPASNF